MKEGQIEYIGDGAYVKFDGWGFWLLANDHLNPTDKVYIDGPKSAEALVRLIKGNLRTKRNNAMSEATEQFPNTNDIRGVDVDNDTVTIDTARYIEMRHKESLINSLRHLWNAQQIDFNYSVHDADAEEWRNLFIQKTAEKEATG